MTLLAASAAVLLSVSDPQGDALGDGAYSLPAAVDPATLDLRSMTVLDVRGRLELRFAMARLSNPARAPNGFTDPVLDVYVGRQRDPQGDLGLTGFRTPPGAGWRYRLRVTGWAARLELRPGLPPDAASATSGSAGEAGLGVRVEGAQIVVSTPIPAAAYSYWAFVGLYDPLTVDGLKQPVARAGPFALASSLDRAPAALDVLSATSQAPYYASREVPALGRPPQDRSGALLATGLAGATLALGATVWGFFRR